MRLLDILEARAYATRKLEDRTVFQGLKISIENRKGSTRKGVDKSGTPWQVTMTYPYGYICRTEGVDGDHVDCFVGPNPDATHAYVIHTNDSEGNFDEDKCMLGFNSTSEAKEAFLENYSSPKFFRSMDALPMETFKEKVLATMDNPKKITASELHLPEKSTLSIGTEVKVDGLPGRGIVTRFQNGRYTIKYRSGLEISRTINNIHVI